MNYGKVITRLQQWVPSIVRQPPMPATMQLEAHPLDVLDGIHCPTCRTDTVTHVRVAIVASDSLRVLGHVDAEACASCDRLEVTRL